MPKESSQSLVEKALAAIGLLWDETDAKKHMSSADAVEALEKKGYSVDARFLRAVADGAKNAGMPIERPRGQGNRSEGFRIEKRPFETWELALLADAIQSSKAVGDAEKNRICDALTRLAPAGERADVVRVVVSKSSSQASDTGRKLASIQEGISSRSRIRFVYHDCGARGEKTVRASSSNVPIEPYAFVYADDAYYLLAGKPSDSGMLPRTYRVDRMEDIETTRDTCSSNLHAVFPDIQKRFDGSFGMHLGGEIERATLSFPKGISKCVADRFGAAAIEPDGEGRAKACVDVVASPRFFAWVMGYGGALEIAAPESLRARYEAALEQALAAAREHGEN